MTPAQFAAIFPHAKADVWAPAISRAWERFGFRSIESQAGFLGICGNETGGFVRVDREVMKYTVARAVRVFKKAREHPAECADRIAKGPVAFANWVYADRIGNGPESSGDGWAFRGGGICQLTGMANYAACGYALGVALTKDPGLVCRDPIVSAAAAAWFMSAYRPLILGTLDRRDEPSFLCAATLVGWTDAAATQRRLDYRKKALDVLALPTISPAPATWSAWMWKMLGRG